MTTDSEPPQPFNTAANFQSQDQSASPAFLIQDGMPTNFQRPPFIDAGFGNGNNVTTSIISEAARMPVTHTWRLDIQRELPRNVLSKAGYAGTRGLHLNAAGLRQFNQLPVARAGPWMSRRGRARRSKVARPPFCRGTLR